MEISHEQYIAAFNKLPPPIRSYLIDDELSATVQKIGAQYGLHVDAIGALGTSASYMLMGLRSPAETVGELVLAGVDGAMAQKILGDLNTQVFMPVRDRVKNYKGDDETIPADSAEKAESLTRTTTPAAAPETPSALPSEPPVAETPLMEQAVVAPPAPPAAAVMPQVISHSPIPVASSPIAAPQPAVPVSMPPAPTVPPQVPAPAPAYAPPGEQDGPSVRTMATDMQAVREHRAAAPIPYAPSAPMPSTPVPAPEPYVPPAAARSVPPPPPNLPGTGPATKEYGVDPYREPVE